MKQLKKFSKNVNEEQRMKNGVEKLKEEVKMDQKAQLKGQE